jgi:hypothetical protein
MDTLTITIKKDFICIKRKKELKPLTKKYISCLQALHDKLKINI